MFDPHDTRTDIIYEMIFDEFLCEDTDLVKCQSCSGELHFDESEVLENGILLCPSCYRNYIDSDV